MLSLLLTIAGQSLRADSPGPEVKVTSGSALGKDSEKDPWDVNQSHAKDFDQVTIKTQETTWSDVTLSPDGRWLVFDMLGDIYRVSTQGGQAEALTTSLAWDFQPVYSPDGRTLAFISDRDGSDNLWVMDADGKNPRQLSQEKAHMIHTPSFSPDGQYLVVRKGFVSSRSIPAGEIWLYHLRGGAGSQMRERLHGKSSQKNIGEPLFSPDGQYVYYSLDNTPGRVWQYNKNSVDEIYEIRRWNLATGEEESITGGPGGAVRPTISHDGKSLAFVKRVDFTSALFIKDMTSGVEDQVYSGLDRDLQESNGTQGNTPRFAFTADDQAIVFWAKGHFHRLDLNSRQTSIIPVTIETQKSIAHAVRFAVKVAPDQFQVKMPRWAQYSPDGKTIYFQALGYLYRKSLRDGAIERVTDQVESFESYPSLSRDGRYLVYTTWNDSLAGHVKIWDLQRKRSTTVSPEPGHYIEAQFSPDGKSIVYHKVAGGYLLNRKWSQNPGIYYAKIGGKATKLRVNGDDPHFGASNQRIYFSEFDYEENQLKLVSTNLKGLDRREHFRGEDITAFRVSPDGRYLAFIEQFKIFVAPMIRTGKLIEINSQSELVKVSRLSNQSGDFLSWQGRKQQLTWSQGPKVYNQTLATIFAYEDQKIKEARLEMGPKKADQNPDKPKDAAAQKDDQTKDLVPDSFVDLQFIFDQAKPQGLKALVGARVVTMRDADHSQEVIEDGTVLIEGDRLREVGPSAQVKIPKGSQIIDAKGTTIIPGLVDVHAHGGQGRSELIPQQNWINYSNLSFGVTTIHDPSNDTSEIFAASELQKAGRVVAPRLFSTGTILYGAYASGATAKIKSYQDALFHVQRLKDVGAISVKSYQQPMRSSRQMVIKAGKELGIMVVPEGGARFQYNMGMIADGHTGIEHAIPLATAYADVIQFWSASQTYYTPTLVVAYGGLAGEKYWYQHTNVWQNPRLMRYVPPYVVEPLAMRREKAPEGHYNHIAVAQFAKKLRDNGVRVQIGAHGQREGLAAHWEMWMLAQGGFTPWQALRAASWDGAHYLGMDKDLGSLEKGKLADLVVINGNPLEDIRQSEMVKFTVQGGRVFDVTTMNEWGDRDHPRQKFYFESNHVSGPEPSAARYWQEKSHRLHWVH